MCERTTSDKVTAGIHSYENSFDLSQDFLRGQPKTKYKFRCFFFSQKSRKTKSRVEKCLSLVHFRIFPPRLFEEWNSCCTDVTIVEMWHSPPNASVPVCPGVLACGFKRVRTEDGWLGITHKKGGPGMSFNDPIAQMSCDVS